MRAIATICVYGSFDKGDVRIKVLNPSDTKQFAFQNILKEAGYDAVLFSLNDEDVINANKAIAEITFKPKE